MQVGEPYVIFDSYPRLILIKAARVQLCSGSKIAFLFAFGSYLPFVKVYMRTAFGKQTLRNVNYMLLTSFTLFSSPLFSATYN